MTTVEYEKKVVATGGSLSLGIPVDIVRSNKLVSGSSLHIVYDVEQHEMKLKFPFELGSEDDPATMPLPSYVPRVEYTKICDFLQSHRKYSRVKLIEMLGNTKQKKINSTVVLKYLTEIGYVIGNGVDVEWVRDESTSDAVKAVAAQFKSEPTNVPEIDDIVTLPEKPLCPKCNCRYIEPGNATCMICKGSE